VVLEFRCGRPGGSVSGSRALSYYPPLLLRKPADRQGLVVRCERSEFRGAGGSGSLLLSKLEIQLI
jgi:hypothetical protein